MAGKTLSIRRILQRHTNWCWAAAAEMVLKYYHGGRGASQCRLVNDFLNRTDCCRGYKTFPDACNQDVDTPVIGQVYDNWQVKHTLHQGGVGFAKLKDEIEIGQPVEVGYEWNGGGYHVVIVKGYREDPGGQFVVFNDPDSWRSIGDQSIQDFTTANGKASWWRTWTGIKL